MKVDSRSSWDETPRDRGRPAGSGLAPIAIFAHRRPHHVGRLIDSLLLNEPFARSPVSVFCDGARSEQEREAVEETRSVVRARLGSHARIIESEANKGLSRSIIGGVSELCRDHGRVIVLEDDLYLHRGCLDFLNAALERYADDDRVCHVNAYRYPLPPAPSPCFSRLTSSWGWATWQRAWAHFEPDAAELERRIREAGLARALDFDGAATYFRMLQNQVQGRIDSWAIRWYASMLLRGRLALCPNVSQVSNRGLDNTGEHCDATSSFDVETGAASCDWPAEVAEDRENFRQTQRFFRTLRVSIPQRIARKLKRLVAASQPGGSFGAK